MMLSNIVFNNERPSLSHYCCYTRFTKMLSKICPRPFRLSYKNKNMLFRRIFDCNYGRYYRTYEKGYLEYNHKPVEKLSRTAIIEERRLQDFTYVVECDGCNINIARRNKIIAYLFIKNYFNI